MKSIPIIKQGTIDLDICETNPVVFNGKLYRFEYVRPRYWANVFRETRPRADSGMGGGAGGESYFRFVDVESGKIGEPFGIGLHLGNAFSWEGKMVVTAVEDWAKSRFYQLESDDLVHWSEPRVILEDPAWEGYNTSMCRADGRFLLTFELGEPIELVKNRFSMFFAESYDLKTWRFLPDKHFDLDIYTGGPMVRYFDGWYYFFYLHYHPRDAGKESYREHVARSRDLVHWEWSKFNPILDYGDDDRKLGRADFTPEQIEKIRTAEDFNVSDLDMCGWKNGVYMVYAWGNQHGTEFLAEAKVENMTEAEFCASLF